VFRHPARPARCHASNLADRLRFRHPGRPARPSPRGPQPTFTSLCGAERGVWTAKTPSPQRPSETSQPWRCSPSFFP